MKNELQEAFQRNEFCIYYQPQYDLQTKKLNGAEALLRWNHPKLGLLLPNKFIRQAEDTDLIILLGEWVLRQACQQAKQWQNLGLDLNTIAVNVSDRQFQEPGFIDTVQNILHEVGLEPRFLELEVTENVVMKEATVQTLEKLRELGVKLAIDDFGTGYSSMSQLKHLPVDKLKIDRSFIQGLPQDINSAAITKAIVTLGKSLQMHICVEGLEEEEQIDFVSAVGCDQAQGYYYSFPLSGSEFFSHIQQSNIIPSFTNAALTPQPA